MVCCFKQAKGGFGTLLTSLCFLFEKKNLIRDYQYEGLTRRLKSLPFNKEDITDAKPHLLFLYPCKL
eukprot:snap_masked-scaffold_52-processed-gene-0.23-mRNA-1 protein AED:1.00 eAED:1.00 QI:0/0/0/0/1/1/2/0/66